MTSSRSDHLFLLKLFFNFAVMDRIFHGNLDDVLSRCTEFDHMEGKFVASRAREICPRIAKLQDNLGFAPGESLTSTNLHLLIPAAKDIQSIMGRRRCESPMESFQERKTPNQQRLVPYFKVHTPKHETNRKVLPSIRRIKDDWKNPLGIEDSSKSNKDFDSNYKKDFSTSNVYKNIDKSFLNKSLPYLNKSFSDSKSRKSWNVSKSNKESGVLNLNKGRRTFRSMKDFSVPQWNTNICAKTLTNQSTDFSKWDLTDDIGVPISKLNNFETQSFDSILNEDLEVNIGEDDKENLHEILF